MAKPCADKADCNEFKQINMTQDAHQKEHADEVCSPLCVCSCCSTHILLKDYSPSLSGVPIVNAEYKIQEDSKVSSIIISIWQPPKI